MAAFCRLGTTQRIAVPIYRINVILATNSGDSLGLPIGVPRQSFGKRREAELTCSSSVPSPFVIQSLDNFKATVLS